MSETINWIDGEKWVLNELLIKDRPVKRIIVVKKDLQEGLRTEYALRLYSGHEIHRITEEFWEEYDYLPIEKKRSL